MRLYGGTERIVQWLAQELIKLGHEVTLVARAGSDLPGVRCIAAETRDEALQRIPDDVDLCHFHAWPPPDEFARKPWVFTLHGNLAPGEKAPLRTIGISADHAKRHGLKAFIYNGIDPAEFIYRGEKKDQLLFFSKVRRRVKGARRALALARAARQNLVVAGGYRADLLKVGGLFDSFHPSIRFVGEVGGIAKAELFANAKALLFPIDWEEPFGLVIIEALMSGTPVVATPRGSVPELVPRSVGAIFSLDLEFADALAHAATCRPADCRQWAMEHFSAEVCARNHVTLYERLADGALF